MLHCDGAYHSSYSIIYYILPLVDEATEQQLGPGSHVLDGDPDPTREGNNLGERGVPL